jgi:hypothetical protein
VLEYKRRKKMQVIVLPEIISSDQLEGWLSRELVVELSKDVVDDLTPRSLRLPLLEQGRPRGYLDGRLKGIEDFAGIRFLVIRARLDGQKVHASVEWDAVLRQFDLEDTTHVLWRGKEFDSAAWERWTGDLAKIGLQAKAGVLGERIAPGLDMRHLEPSLENAWALWLAAWRFGDAVGLSVGMRREALIEAFRVLRERFPELPLSLFERSREIESWGKEDVKRLRVSR